MNFFVVLFVLFFFQTMLYATDNINIVAHSPASSLAYLGSPSILKTSCGSILISNDEFGPGANLYKTFINSSTDDGKTWQRVAILDGQYWSSLFNRDDEVYILGVTKVGGNIVLRRSIDCGVTWSVPDSVKTGLFNSTGRFFSAPTPVVKSKGYFWRAFEDHKPNVLAATVLRMPAAGDMLDTTKWRLTNSLDGGDNRWLSGKFKGWLEGNLVVTPAGSLKDVMRVYFNELPEKAALIHIDTGSFELKFNPEKDFIDLPGGGKKFTMRYDDVSGRYIALVNNVLPQYKNQNYERVRNTLSIATSLDLITWKVGQIVLSHADSTKHGYQYADWNIYDSDMYIAIRAAEDDQFGGAKSQHDSNFILFYKIQNVRNLIQ